MEAPVSAKPVGAVIAAVKILRHLSRAQRPQTLSEVARAVALYPGTCFQLLWSLAGEQLVAFDPATKTYAPDLGLVELSQAAIQRTGVPEVARPQMRALAAAHGATVFLLHRIREDTLVVLEYARGSSAVEQNVVIGAPLSAWRGATGRIVAAHSGLPAAELRRRFEAEEWQNPPRFEDWLADVEAARRRGIAFDRGNLYLGISSAAAAIPEIEAAAELNAVERQPAFFLGAVCLTAQIDDDRLAAIAAAISNVATIIGTQLGRLGAR